MNKNDFFQPCTRHRYRNWMRDCNECLVEAIGRMASEITRLSDQWEERLNENFDTEHNSYSVRGELGTLADLITPPTDPMELWRGFSDFGEANSSERVDTSGTESSGSDATPVTGDRGIGEREDSVGRRRRRQEYDGLGILHEEGSDQ